MNIERFNERKERLRRFLEMEETPNVFIVSECRLILEAHHGGPWRLVGSLLLLAMKRAWQWRVVGPAYRILHAGVTKLSR